MGLEDGLWSTFVVGAIVGSKLVAIVVGSSAGDTVGFLVVGIAV